MAKEVNIYILTMDRSDQIQLPVVPPQIAMEYESEHIVYNTIRQGEINLLGLEKLTRLTIESFFPISERPYSRNKDMFGWAYVDKLRQWQKDRIPVRVIFTDTPINELMSISKITPSVRTGNGDVYYTLELVGFKEIKLEEVKK